MIILIPGIYCIHRVIGLSFLHSCLFNTCNEISAGNKRNLYLNFSSVFNFQDDPCVKCDAYMIVIALLCENDFGTKGGGVFNIT